MLYYILVFVIISHRTEEEPGTVLLSIVVQSSDNRAFDFQDEPIQITFKPKVRKSATWICRNFYLFMYLLVVMYGRYY